VAIRASYIGREPPADRPQNLVRNFKRSLGFLRIKSAAGNIVTMHTANDSRREATPDSRLPTPYLLPTSLLLLSVLRNCKNSATGLERQI
jgi:hypothetical protein